MVKKFQAGVPVCRTLLRRKWTSSYSSYPVILIMMKTADHLNEGLELNYHIAWILISYWSTTVASVPGQKARKDHCYGPQTFCTFLSTMTHYKSLTFLAYEFVYVLNLFKTVILLLFVVLFEGVVSLLCHFNVHVMGQLKNNSVNHFGEICEMGCQSKVEEVYSQDEQLFRWEWLFGRVGVERMVNYGFFFMKTEFSTKEKQVIC